MRTEGIPTCEDGSHTTQDHLLFFEECRAQVPPFLRCGWGDRRRKDTSRRRTARLYRRWCPRWSDDLPDPAPRCDDGGHTAPALPFEVTAWLAWWDEQTSPMDPVTLRGRRRYSFADWLAWAHVVESRAPGALLVRSLAGERPDFRSVPDISDVDPRTVVEIHQGSAWSDESDGGTTVARFPGTIAPVLTSATRAGAAPYTDEGYCNVRSRFRHRRCRGKAPLSGESGSRRAWRENEGPQGVLVGSCWPAWYAHRLPWKQEAHFTATPSGFFVAVVPPWRHVGVMVGMDRCWRRHLMRAHLAAPAGGVVGCTHGPSLG